jgi:hypothetical protein
MSSELEEAAFAHVRQEAELEIVTVPPKIAVFLIVGENALVVPLGEA